MVKPEPYQGTWVRQHRELLGLTQADLAEAVREDGGRLSRSHLANIEAGMYGASPDLIKTIATLHGLDIRDTWRHVGTLPRTRHERAPTLHQVSQVDDTGPAPLSAQADERHRPPPPGPHASATELLSWSRDTLASFGHPGSPHDVVLSTIGPLAAALRMAPPPGGILGGLLGKGIRAVLDQGAELRHILAVPDDPEAHFEVLAEALPLAARYCLPPARSRPYLSRYNLTLVPGPLASPDLIASSQSPSASMLIPVISAGRPGAAVVEASPQDAGQTADRPWGWALEYASWLAARGTDLFSWVTVVPAGTLSMPHEPWEERLTQAWEHPGGRDSIQRMLPLNTMSDDLRSQLVASQARGQHLPPASAGREVRRRVASYQARRNAMIRNLENGYSYRNIVTREGLNDLIDHGQYTMEHLPGNVLTPQQVSSYLHATMDLIRSFENFEVLILTDDQLEQALPLGVSWIVKRSPHSQPGSSGPAWAFLPYTLDGQPMAMNVIISDDLAIDAICARIDALWSTWAEKRTREQIRQETLTELENARNRIGVR